NIPDTWASTPGWFCTSAESTCRIRPEPCPAVAELMVTVSTVLYPGLRRQPRTMKEANNVRSQRPSRKGEQGHAIVVDTPKGRPVRVTAGETGPASCPIGGA